MVSSMREVILVWTKKKFICTADLRIRGAALICGNQKLEGFNASPALP